MVLGFYYHVTVKKIEGKIFLASYLGLFVDELAKNVDKLSYFAFTTNKKNIEQNYCLTQKNIEFIDLGQKQNSPYLLIFGGHIIRRVKQEAAQCNTILVRGPSPLAPHFYFRFRKLAKVAYLMVGDSMEGIKYQTNPFLRQKFINLFTYFYEYVQNKVIRHTVCLVNSTVLKRKYERINKNVKEIKTTTLSESDFFKRTDTCLNQNNINLLFVGRIEKAKGVEELFEAFKKLRKDGFHLVLHIAGWDTEDALRYQASFLKQIDDKNSMIFHGFKTSSELLQLYRMADIYILPSHHEGFPRTIWEAMANCLPVVSSNVGSIPFYLEHEKHILMVAPHDIDALYFSIKKMIEEHSLRQKLIANSYILAKEVTLEIQTKLLIEAIK